MWLGRIGKLREQDSSLREGLGEVVLPVRALAGAVIAPATPPPLATVRAGAPSTSRRPRNPTPVGHGVVQCVPLWRVERCQAVGAQQVARPRRP